MALYCNRCSVTSIELGFYLHTPGTILCMHILLSWLVGWLVGWLFRPFETVFQSTLGHLPERKKVKRKDKREKRCPNNIDILQLFTWYRST